MENSQKIRPNRDYLKYLIAHKRDVYRTGRELGAPRTQLLLHDWTKFKPKSFRTYRDYWFGAEGINRGGTPDPETTTKFKAEARRHYKSEDHHLHKRIPPTPLTLLPQNLRKEIVSDWYSVSNYKTPTNLSIHQWLQKNKYQNLVHS